MRIDDFLSTVGIIVRRTVAKEMARHGLLVVNGHRVKPAYLVKVQDIIQVKGTQGLVFEVLAIPDGSVSRETRGRYYKPLNVTA